MGGLLAADVLLAGLEREDEAAAAVDVGGLARDAAGHAAQVLLGGGEEAERRAAEVEAAAERLALADGDVHPALARRSQDAERDRVDRGDAERARLVGGGGERLEVLDPAEEVGVLDEDRGGLVVERRRELRRRPSARPRAQPRPPPRRNRARRSRSVARLCGWRPRETTSRRRPFVAPSAR